MVADKKVQDFLYFHGARSWYIICASGEVQGTEPQDKDVDVCEGSDSL